MWRIRSSSSIPAPSLPRERLRRSRTTSRESRPIWDARTMPLLELKAVSVGYGRNRILQNVNLTLERGEIVTLLGANGAGKSTLAKSISGFPRADPGLILLEGEPIGAMPPAERLRRGIAHVPEGRQIFAGMTVAENLELGAYASAEADHAERLESVFALFPVLRERMRDI